VVGPPLPSELGWCEHSQGDQQVPDRFALATAVKRVRLGGDTGDFAEVAEEGDLPSGAGPPQNICATP
jgi:hypothetical protein